MNLAAAAAAALAVLSPLVSASAFANVSDYTTPSCTAVRSSAVVPVSFPNEPVICLTGEAAKNASADLAKVTAAQYYTLINGNSTLAVFGCPSPVCAQPCTQVIAAIPEPQVKPNSFGTCPYSFRLVADPRPVEPKPSKEAGSSGPSAALIASIAVAVLLAIGLAVLAFSKFGPRKSKAGDDRLESGLEQKPRAIPVEAAAKQAVPVAETAVKPTATALVVPAPVYTIDPSAASDESAAQADLLSSSSSATSRVVPAPAFPSNDRVPSVNTFQLPPTTISESPVFDMPITTPAKPAAAAGPSKAVAAAVATSRVVPAPAFSISQTAMSLCRTRRVHRRQRLPRLALCLHPPF
ncbi:hypothetical protein BC831DRAFT_491749, partial [Entophlyctis helioformis]